MLPKLSIMTHLFTVQHTNANVAVGFTCFSFLLVVLNTDEEGEELRTEKVMASSTRVLVHWLYFLNGV